MPDRDAAIKLLVKMREHLANAMQSLDQFDKYSSDLRNLGWEESPASYNITATNLCGMFEITVEDIDEWIRDLPNPASREEIFADRKLEWLTARIKRGKNLSRKERLGVLANWTCHYCKKPGTLLLGPDGHVWHSEHRIPRARGGPNTITNCVLSCRSCNMHKRTMTDVEFLLLLETEAVLAQGR